MVKFLEQEVPELFQVVPGTKRGRPRKYKTQEDFLDEANRKAKLRYHVAKVQALGGTASLD